MKALSELPRPARDGQLRCTATGARAQDTIRFYVQQCVLPFHEGNEHRYQWQEEELTE